MIDSSATAVHIWFPGVSNDTVFTTVVTISIFILGYLFNRFYEGRKEKRKLKDIRKFVLSCLESILPAIEKQITAFNSIAQQIASRKHQDYIFQESTSLNFEALDSLPRTDIFYAFTKTRKRDHLKKIQHLNNLWVAIDFIRHQKPMARDTFVQFNENYKRYLHIWNENIDLILRLHDEYLTIAKQASISPSQDPFLKEFDLLVYKLEESGESSAWEHIKSHLVDPLLEICKAHSVDSRALVVLKKVIQAKYAYGDREHLLHSFTTYFEQQAKGLSEEMNSIIQTVRFFK